MGTVVESFSLLVSMGLSTNQFFFFRVSKFGHVWWKYIKYPLVMTNIAIEYGHRKSEFSHLKRGWFSIVMLVHQRVHGFNSGFSKPVHWGLERRLTDPKKRQVTRYRTIAPCRSRPCGEDCRRIGGWLGMLYPLVDIQKAIENHHF